MLADFLAEEARKFLPIGCLRMQNAEASIACLVYRIVGKSANLEGWREGGAEEVRAQEMWVGRGGTGCNERNLRLSGEPGYRRQVTRKQRSDHCDRMILRERLLKFVSRPALRSFTILDEQADRA